MFSKISEEHIEEYEKNYPRKSKRPCEYACKSTDTKETTGITNGSSCIEMDTGKVFMFDQDTSTWYEL